MSKYRHVIFDADHTLIDFAKDERRALRAVIADIPPLKTSGGPSIADMPSTGEQVVARLQAYSARNWAEMGLDDVSNPATQQWYHARTYLHVHALMQYAAKEFGLLNPDAAECVFLDALSQPAHLCEGAMEIVKMAAFGCKVSIATNGLSQMQRARLIEFGPYRYELFISEEMGAIKPMDEFGKIMLKTLQAQAQECLFVGDSLASDIALANKLGMDAIWVNPEGRPLPEGVKIKGQIRTLDELLNYI